MFQRDLHQGFTYTWHILVGFASLIILYELIEYDVSNFYLKWVHSAGSALCISYRCYELFCLLLNWKKKRKWSDGRLFDAHSNYCYCLTFKSLRMTKPHAYCFGVALRRISAIVSLRWRQCLFDACYLALIRINVIAKTRAFKINLDIKYALANNKFTHRPMDLYSKLVSTSIIT